VLSWSARRRTQSEGHVIEGRTERAVGARRKRAESDPLSAPRFSRFSRRFLAAAIITSSTRANALLQVKPGNAELENRVMRFASESGRSAIVKLEGIMVGVP